MKQTDKSGEAGGASKSMRRIAVCNCTMRLRFERLNAKPKGQVSHLNSMRHAMRTLAAYEKFECFGT
eukprot:6201108-Pleurochrysis_carterae.AAC.2